MKRRRGRATVAFLKLLSRFPCGGGGQWCDESICDKFDNRKCKFYLQNKHSFTLTQKFVYKSYTILFEVIHFLTNHMLNLIFPKKTDLMLRRLFFNLLTLESLR